MVIGLVPKIESAILKSSLPAVVKQYVCHPAGPLTVFFWAGMAKWGLALSNLNELRKPVEMIATKQQCVAIASGLVWTRYSMVITPVNYSLAGANFFLACTGFYQLYRKWQAGQLTE